MAVVRNVSGDDLFVPLAGVIVADGETFELPDAVFDQYQFGPMFKVVDEPARKPVDDKKKEK